MKSGILAEFETTRALLAAIEAMRAAGFRDMDAYTPYPVKEVMEALALPRSRVPLYALGAGIFGAGYAYLIQWWANGFAYALNVGSRPLGAVPAFIPATFEGTVILASLTAVVSFLGFSRIPRLYAPVAEVEGFDRASIDRYFLALDERDPAFDSAVALQILRDADALRVSVFPPEIIPEPTGMGGGEG